MPFILSFFHHCHVALTEYSSIFVTLFIAGLIGGFSHCFAMCGPFVLTQVMHRTENIPVAKIMCLTRLKSAALLPYHFGRITTYVLLAVLTTILSKVFISAEGFRILSSLFLTFAAFLLIGSNIKMIPISRFLPKPSLLTNILKTLYTNPTGIKGYFLGVMLGFLPCALVMAAILVAASTANVFFAGLAMLVFGLATVPALLLVGLGSSYLLGVKKAKIAKIARIVMVFNAVFLLLTAGKIVLR